MRAFRIATVLALCVAGNSAAQVPDLIADLQSSSNDTRRAAARKLGEQGEEGKKAIPALTKALHIDTDTFVRRFAAQSLGSFGPEKGVVAALTKALEDKQSRVVEAAAAALGEMGKEGVKPLADVIGNKKLGAATRRRAIVSMGKIGAEAKVGVPALIEALKDRDVRLNAAEALGNVGPNAKPALETFKAMMEDRRIRRDRSFAQAVRTAMRKIGK